MNRFDKEVQKRTKRALRLIGLGNISYRHFVRMVRNKLKEDIKLGKIKLC